ncbi:MAG TPA: aminopeptidase [Longimicrobiales bacterium]|nr:aminopeptidase [Longimicrobiales bacterium]
MKRPSRKTFVILTLLFVAGATWTCSACSAGYILRAGYEEAKILARREPIRDIIAAPATPPEVRRRLELVLTARDFAEHSLGLDAGDSYTTYSRVDRDTLALILSGARRDRFSAVTWWFPIVGSVPYKGYFDMDDALEAQRELEDDGFDTFLRPTAAFSTLGWFNDPLLSTVLRYGDVSIVSTVIHELTHNSLYLPGQAGFNESFANFVGDRGAVALFCGMDGPASERCARTTDEWADNLAFAAFLNGLVAELTTLYQREDIDAAQKLALREPIFERARLRFRDDVLPPMRTDRFRGFERLPMNNATLMARRLYYDRLDRFEAVFERLGRDLPRAIEAIIEAAEAHPDDPWLGLERLASG